MKKSFFYAITLLTACTMLMVGCKNNPNEPDQPEQPGQEEQPTAAKAVAAVLDYTFEISEDMLEVGDFTVFYYDSVGKIQSEQLTAPAWRKITISALPAKLGVKLVGVLKENYDPDKYEKIVFSTSYVAVTYRLDEKGEIVDKKKDTNRHSNSIDLPGQKVPAHFEKYKDHFLQAVYSFDEDGNKTELKEWE